MELLSSGYLDSLGESVQMGFTGALSGSLYKGVL